MSALHEIIHENVREGELFEKLDRNWVRCFACGHRWCQHSRTVGSCVSGTDYRSSLRSAGARLLRSPIISGPEFSEGASKRPRRPDRARKGNFNVEETTPRKIHNCSFGLRTFKTLV
jgi:hypothetical protein